MELDIYQVDAFADRPFEGNPAAVCPLPAGVPWPEDDALLAIAAENNLSETAFFQQDGDAYRLRWFTPATEVALCGHATLATAWVMFNRLGVDQERIDFDTASGRLSVMRAGDRLAMDFPANPPTPLDSIPSVVTALGGKPEAALQAPKGNGFLLLVYRSADEVRALKPDFAAMVAHEPGGVIVTAPGENGYDCMSRLFAPGKGINEDPVTGSAHCVLAPYWAGRLGKRSLKARQVSARGGDIDCVLEGDRVRLEGGAVLYMTGRIQI